MAIVSCLSENELIDQYTTANLHVCLYADKIKSCDMRALDGYFDELKYWKVIAIEMLEQMEELGIC